MRFFVLLSGLLLLSAFIPFAAAQPTDEPPLRVGADNSALTDDPHPEVNRWVEGTLLVAQPDFTTMQIQTFLTIRKFEVQGKDYASADAIADTYHQLVQADSFARGNGQESGRADKFVEDMEQKTSASLLELLERAFPGAEITTDVASLDRATLNEPDDKPFAPGISLIASATVKRTPQALGFGNADQEDLEALFDAGAEIVTDITLSSQSGYELTYVLTPTPGTVFSEVDAGTIGANGAQLRVDVPFGSPGVPVGLTLRSPDAPVFTAENASVNILVDLKDLDTSMGKALGGDFGNLVIDLSVTAELGVIKVTEDLRRSLPAKVKLDYLSSDGIRLLKARGLLTDANVTALESKLVDLVATKLGGTLGGTVPVDGGFDAESLASSLMTTPLSGEKPITFKAKAHVSKPLKGGGVQSQAAIALYTTQLPLTLPRIEGLDTVYTVIAPKGLAITGVSGDGVEQGTSEDGRDQFTVRSSSTGSPLVVSLAVTPGFVIAKFWPLVLLVVIVLVLIIGTPIALVRMKKNKAKGTAPQAPKK